MRAWSPRVFLDTHAAVFLHAGRTEAFTATGLTLLEQEPLFLSPMAFLELQYLHDIGRLRFDAEALVKDLETDLGLRLHDAGWARSARAAAAFTFTRDPFDRFIAAQALVEGQRLLTKDRVLLEHCSWALW